MQKKIHYIRSFVVVVLSIILTSCAPYYNDISVKNVNGFRLKGIKSKVVDFSFNVEIDNPNTRKISVTSIEFKTWLNNREFGDFALVESVKLIPCSRETYTVHATVKLNSMADVLRLGSMAGLETLADKMEVEGMVKGKSFPVRKTIKIPRQPMSKLSSLL